MTGPTCKIADGVSGVSVRYQGGRQVSRGNTESKRTRDVRVRLSDDEWAVWNAAREASGRKEMGAWLRAFVTHILTGTNPDRRPGDLPRVMVPPVNRDAVQQLLRVGNNLNQLAHAANAEGRITDLGELRRVLVQVEDTLRQVRGQHARRVPADAVTVDLPPRQQAPALEPPDAPDTASESPRRRRWFGAAR